MVGSMDDPRGGPRHESSQSINEGEDPIASGISHGRRMPSLGQFGAMTVAARRTP